MKYRVIYKRMSTLTKALDLVEDVVDADGFDVEAGCLVFYTRDDETNRYHNTLAIPAGMWLPVEAESESGLVQR